MKGLIWKDICLMGVLVKSYVIICFVFLILSVAGVYDGSFVATFLVMIGVMIPINTFAYDEQAKWDKYAAALPVGRRGVVQAKYLFTVLVCLTCISLSVLSQLLLLALGKADAENLVQVMLVSVAPGGAGALMNAVLLPLLFKFGSQKGRLYLMLVMGVAVGGFVGGALAISKLGLDNGILVALMSAAPVLGFLSLVPSYFLSMGIYQKKDL